MFWFRLVKEERGMAPYVVLKAIRGWPLPARRRARLPCNRYGLSCHQTSLRWHEPGREAHGALAMPACGPHPPGLRIRRGLDMRSLADRLPGGWARANARRTLRAGGRGPTPAPRRRQRSEEHTSELQSLMRISYAVFCLKKKKLHKEIRTNK